MFDWITSLIDQMGVVGIALMMFLENVFPPIPSELIMPLAGFNAARGETSVVAVILAGSVGSLLGAYLWYWIARKIGYDRIRHLSQRHGRWLSVSPEELDRANDWFDRHDAGAVLIGRMIPTIRTLISVPAGVRRMPRGWFLGLSAIGTVVWTAALTLAGYWLEGGYETVSAWLNPVSTAVVIGLVAVYVWRVATYDRRVAQRGREAH